MEAKRPGSDVWEEAFYAGCPGRYFFKNYFSSRPVFNDYPEYQCEIKIPIKIIK